MKRSELKRKTPLARGRSTLARSAKPMKAKSKTNAKRPSGGEDKLCRGQSCYLAIPGICIGGTETVVPCHSNQGGKHGKGMGIKALDLYTVPGCYACHREIDQGMIFTKAEKFAIWNAAYERWSVVRQSL